MQATTPPAQTALRPPQQVMTTARIGRFHQTRLSFMRALLRALKRDGWQFSCQRFEMDARGVGLALYSAIGHEHRYTLVCFGNDLSTEKRSDRVIATEWDATFVLYDGVPDEVALRRLATQVPKQEAGCYQASEWVLARANRSVRLFSHVVERLAGGLQPDPTMLDKCGYLMRTTAVYANGKFGLRDRQAEDRVEFCAPFRAELLTVWLIRWFTIDLVEHLAHLENPHKAVKLSPVLARQIGVGNATGLGMAPFLVLHPSLLHRWIHARETALARVRALPACDSVTRHQFTRLLARQQRGLEGWHTDDHKQHLQIEELKVDLAKIARHIDQNALEKIMPWDAFMHWSQTALSVEGQELLVTLMLEPHGQLIDDLTECMASDETQYWRIRGEQTIAELINAIESHYLWALTIDYTDPAECARFWYVSKEKLEPRLGERFVDSGAEWELPLAIARDISALHAALKKNVPDASVATFLLAYPQYRHAVRRVQISARLPYAEIRDNLISARLLAIDLLRCKLSFFGATRFDPKSDRWIRITMYQHAPLPNELAYMNVDDWSYPPLNPAMDDDK